MRGVLVYFGVFLVALSGLMFEIGLTRIFSATIWYHFAFVAISVALLGWGLGGLLMQRWKRRWQPTLDGAAWISLGYAASIPLCLALIVRFPFRQELLPLYFGASLFPFLLGGMVLSAVFDIRRENAPKLYFWDLAGASLGALVVTFLLSWLGGETAVLAVALAPAAAAACFSPKRVAVASIAVVILGAAVAMNERSGLFRIHSAPTKGMYQHLAANPGTSVTQTGWNAYSRIDAVEGFEKPYLARLYIDSDAWTNVLRAEVETDRVQPMRTWYRALPFRGMHEPEVLVIGPGGGSDVRVSLAAGAKHVTAVELNPLMLEFVRHYGAQAGNLYDQPQVEVLLGEGRNYVSRCERKFDVIFLGFVDSWASVSSGGLSLSENYLYTVEAFRAYYDHLTDDGMLVILRWEMDIPRLVTNSVALLGASDASSRVVALLEKEHGPGDPPQMTFMLRKRPFTDSETKEIHESWTAAKPVIVPGRHVEPPYDGLLSGAVSLPQFASAARDIVDAVYDDSPFYFATERPIGLPPIITRALFRLLGIGLALFAVFAWRGRPRGGGSRSYAASLAYFGCLGFGFIAVELSLMQRLILLLGHPIFTLAVLLFTLLASSGVGSWMSGRISVRRACLCVAALALLYTFALPPLVGVLLPLPLAARIALTIVLVAPLGFMMGMPFPQGLRAAGRGPLPAPPFYWGLNGIMSVVGSGSTMLIAVTLGFRAAMLAGVVCYAIAAWASRRVSEAEVDVQPVGQA
jgi:predicted membrane-bound spermidine synthase